MIRVTRRAPAFMLTAFLVSGMLSSAFADWQAVPDPFGGSAWKVENSETGQTLVKNYKTKKQAKKAAKTMNKADKSVMPGPNGEGDFRGGNLPK